jgi:hypothetical protein
MLLCSIIKQNMNNQNGQASIFMMQRLILVRDEFLEVALCGCGGFFSTKRLFCALYPEQVWP